MGATIVGRLLYEMARDEVVPERYSRKSLSVRFLPVLHMSGAAIGVLVLSIALGRL